MSMTELHVNDTIVDVVRQTAERDTVNVVGAAANNVTIHLGHGN